MSPEKPRWTCQELSGTVIWTAGRELDVIDGPEGKAERG
jgi:hypothetical protein